jgi:sugar phosphate isomerase/epimerase
MPDFAITTDYVTSHGSPLPYLARIAQAGWKWIHWCHHWNDDHSYTNVELAEIERTFQNLNLKILDIHGSAGRWRRWDSRWTLSRIPGVHLVRNRIDMAHRLGCDVVIMHPARMPDASLRRQPYWDALRRSVDALLPDLRRNNVRLAMENMEQDNFDQLEQLMNLYPPDQLGLCYDPGHGNIAGNGLARLAPLTSRLIALHLNDNDAKRDLHQLPFQGTVDWQILAALINQSRYNRPAISAEISIKHSGITDEQTFLKQSLAAANRFGEMLLPSSR